MSYISLILCDQVTDRISLLAAWCYAGTRQLLSAIYKYKGIQVYKHIIKNLSFHFAKFLYPAIHFFNRDLAFYLSGSGIGFNIMLQL